MLDSPLVEKLIDLALTEDLSLGDVTSDLTVDASLRGRARIIAREELVVCGVPLVARILRALSTDAGCREVAAEGAVVRDGVVLAEIEGSARTILAAERTILNFLQRLSGVATHTRHVVGQARGIAVLDTRKTTPGWRVLEKYAVAVGGARNHRFTLGDMVLVKNNHIDANGGSVTRTLERINAGKPLYMPVEVEVRSIAELREALPFQPTVVMLDNMNDVEIAEAMKLMDAQVKRPLVEVSGGITSDRFDALSALRVDAVSMGALCGRARTVDISLRLEASS